LNLEGRNGWKGQHHTRSVYPLENSKKKFMCVNQRTSMFLTWVCAFWHLMHLKCLRVNGKQLESTTWTWNLTYVINCFSYIYIVCYYMDIFILIQSWNLYSDYLHLHMVERRRLFLMLLNYPRLLIHSQDTSTTPCVVSG
jgi:hypothetical protein